MRTRPVTLATKHFVNGARLKPKIAFHGQTERTSDAYNCEIERLLKTDEGFGTTEAAVSDPESVEPRES